MIIRNWVIAKVDKGGGRCSECGKLGGSSKLDHYLLILVGTVFVVSSLAGRGRRDDSRLTV